MENNEIRVNLLIDKETYPEAYKFLEKIPKRKRATVIRNILEEIQKKTKNKPLN
jgi:hypothetical protein